MKFAKKVAAMSIFTFAMSFAAFAEDFKVEFKLESPTQLGAYILPTGAYEGVISSAPTPLLRVWSKEGAVSAIALAYVDAGTCSQSSLKITTGTEMPQLNSICLKSTGTSLHFLNTSAKTEMIKAAAKPAQVAETASIR